MTMIDRSENDIANRLAITHKLQRSVESVRLDLKGSKVKKYVGMYRAKGNHKGKRYFFIPLIGGHLSGMSYSAICSLKHNNSIYDLTPLLSTKNGDVIRCVRALGLSIGERYKLVSINDRTFYVASCISNMSDPDILKIYGHYIRGEK